MNTLFSNNQNTFYAQQPVQNQQQNSFAAFVANFMQKFPMMSPQQVGMELLNSGRISQEDFKNFSTIANRLTGRRGGTNV